MVATQRQSGASTIAEPGACSIIAKERRRPPGAVSGRTVIESAIVGVMSSCPFTRIGVLARRLGLHEMGERDKLGGNSLVCRGAPRHRRRSAMHATDSLVS